MAAKPILTTLSPRTRQSLERRIDNHSILVHGARRFGLEALKRFSSSTVTLDVDHQRIIQEPQVYASESVDIAAFCATTWSRDGWSGWITYDTKPRPIYEFFAGPYVLREACFAVGALYVVQRKRFEESQSIPGEYVTHEEVPIEEEYSVDFDDIHQYVYRSIHMAYNLKRAQRLDRPATPLDVDRFLQMDPNNDPRRNRSPDLADNWYEHHAFLT